MQYRIPKLSFFIILHMVLSYAAFGQYFEYVSVGYNTVKTTDKDGREISTWHYFLNDNQFSKMAVDDNNVLMNEEPREGRNWGSGVMVGFFLNGDSFFYLSLGEGYICESEEIFRVADGKLVYAELRYADGYREIKYVSQKIEYTAAGLTVHLVSETSTIIKYFYNIPETELYDKFMNLLVKTIKQIIQIEPNHYNILTDRFARYRLEDEIKKLTKMELAIFRNCLFAEHKYAFQQQMWKDFMGKYYYDNYQGIYSNTQVMRQFSDDEKWLLETIQKYENSNSR